MNRKWIFGLGAIALLSITYAIMVHQRNSAPTTDEFFVQNPHLKPEEKIPELPKIADTNHPANGEYNLVAGKFYPVTWKEQYTFLQTDKAPIERAFSGDVDIHALQFEKGRHSLIFDFHFDSGTIAEKPVADKKDAKNARRLNKTLPKIKNNFRLYAIVSGDGRLETLAREKKIGTEWLQLGVQVIQSLFRYVPDKRVGSFHRRSKDEKGTPLEETTLITDAGNQNLLIDSRLEKMSQVGKEPAKMAAAGLAAVANISLSSEFWAVNKTLWNVAQNLPVSVKTQSQTKMIVMGKTILGSDEQEQSEWGTAQNSNLKLDERLKFKFIVDIDSLRRQRMNQLLAEQKELRAKLPIPNAHRALGALSRNLGKKITDKERDEMLQNLLLGLSDNPAMLADYKRMLLDAAPGSREVTLILGAIGALGTPEAQAAMIDIYNRQYATEVEKTKILQELAVCPQALSPETKTFLTGIYRGNNPTNDPFGNVAGLALGASIAKDGDPETVSMIKSDWNNSSSLFGNNAATISKRSYLLSIMGNSKSNVFNGQIGDSMGSNSAQIRAKAALAVRFAQDDESRDILFNQGLKDRSGDVRASAATALGFQPFDERTRVAAMSCGAGDPDVQVRTECIDVLSLHRDESAVVSFLKDRAGSESDPQLKGKLRGLVE